MLLNNGPGKTGARGRAPRVRRHLTHPLAAPPSEGDALPRTAASLMPDDPGPVGRDDAVLAEAGIDPAALRRAGVTGGDQLDGRGLRAQVRTVLALMPGTTAVPLTDGPDSDFGIRSGTAMVFIRVRDEPPLVDVRSPVLTGVAPTARLYSRLSELTDRMPVARLYCTDETVWASMPVIGCGFQPSHLVLAVGVMTGLADDLDDRLRDEFGGCRFIEATGDDGLGAAG